MRPWCSDCLPRVGDTVSTFSRFRSTGRAPWFSTSARSLACDSEKLPVIWPLPLQIGDWITGAVTAFRSSTMASCLPCSCVETLQNVADPAPVRLKLICHPAGFPLEGCVLYTAVDLEMASPVTCTGPR